MTIAGFPNTLEYVMENSFYLVEFCSDVKFNSKLKYFAGFDLLNCTENFNYVKVPVTENIGVNALGARYFGSCRAPYENYVVNISEGLENIEVGGLQFDNCTIVLPSTVKTLAYSQWDYVGFASWTVQANNVILCSEIPPTRTEYATWDGNKDDSYIEPSDCYSCVRAEILYVPDESIELYREEWTEDKGFFYDEIKGLSELPEELKQSIE